MEGGARLPTHIWATGLVRQWNQDGYPAVLRRRGDQTGGSVIICVDRCDGTSILLGERRTMDGARVWMRLGSGAPVNPLEEAGYLEKAIHRDRDVWVLCVECKEGWPPLNAPLED